MPFVLLYESLGYETVELLLQIFSYRKPTSSSVNLAKSRGNVWFDNATQLPGVIIQHFQTFTFNFDVNSQSETSNIY